MKMRFLSAALLLWAAPLWAQTVEEMPGGATQEASLLSGVSLAYNAGDSTAVVDVRGLKNLKILLKAVPAVGADADTSATTRLAIQVRTHLNAAADSNSIFVEFPYGVTNLGVAAGAADSATVGHLVKGGRNLAWSGEFVVQVQNVRKAHASAIAVNGHDWYYPSGLAIPLDSLFGREFAGDFMSVRVRNMSGNSCTVTLHLVGQR